MHVCMFACMQTFIITTIDILFELFDRVVLPVVLYASEIYGHSDSCIKKLEIFQRSLYNNALKLSKSTPSVMIYGETGTTPLHITIEKRMIGYWLQIIMGSSSKLNYQIYKYVLHLDMQNIYSTQWIRKIKEILQRCGLFHNDNDNENNFIKHKDSL